MLSYSHPYAILKYTLNTQTKITKNKKFRFPRKRCPLSLPTYFPYSTPTASQFPFLIQKNTKYQIAKHPS